MKTYLSFFLLSSMLISCVPMNSNIGIPQAYRYPEQQTKPYQLSELLTVPVQRFVITSYDDTMLVGTEGTEITIRPVCIQTQEQRPASLPFYVELKELYSKGALLKDRACTVSDGALLESDGSLFINAISTHKEALIISCDNAVSIRIPKPIGMNMQYFEGNRDVQGNMNWNLTDSIIQIVGDDPQLPDGAEENWEEMSYNSELLKSAQQYFFSVKKFGYINCDRFYEDSIIKSDVLVQTILPEKGKPFESYTYIVFDSIFSIVPAYLNEQGNWESVNLPSGASVTCISIQKKHDKLYFGSLKISIGTSGIVMPLHQINPSELQKVLDLSL